MPSFLPKGAQRDGTEVDVEVLPPVQTSEGSCLVAAAPHVRVSLPLDMTGSLMWGCDLTPFFDGNGGQLIAFTACLPLGIQLGNAPRPPGAPPAPGQVTVVEAVTLGIEAELAGIRKGDFVRAVTEMGPGIELGWLDRMLGVEQQKMKRVVKVDGLSAEAVE